MLLVPANNSLLWVSALVTVYLIIFQMMQHKLLFFKALINNKIYLIRLFVDLERTVGKMLLPCSVPNSNTQSCIPQQDSVRVMWVVFLELFSLWCRTSLWTMNIPSYQVGKSVLVKIVVAMELYGLEVRLEGPKPLSGSWLQTKFYSRISGFKHFQDVEFSYSKKRRWTHLILISMYI